MPRFAVQLPGPGALGGRIIEVEAPDMQTASQAAQKYARDSQPWVQMNKATNAGQRPEPGKEFPGAGYVPTTGQAAGDLGLLAAMLAAGPVGAAIAPTHPVLAAAGLRTGIGAAPGLMEGDVNKALWGAGATAATEGAASGVGAAPRGLQFLRNLRSPAIHQDINPPATPLLYGPTGRPLAPSPGTGDIVANRVTPGTNPTVYGGGGSSISPTEIRIAPPPQGNWVNAPGQPASPNAAVRIQEPLMPTGGQPTIPSEPRALADTVATKYPEDTLALLKTFLSGMGEGARSGYNALPGLR